MQPKSYRGVMASSTFTDLKEHRQKLLDAIAKFELRPIGMEYSSARADLDVIESSLGFVRDAAAYIVVIGRKYGQTPVCPKRNLDGLSITELEFNEAVRLGRPVLLFLMADDHPPSSPLDREHDPARVKKLLAFKARAKIMREGSEVKRVYDSFSSVEDFATKASVAVGRLAETLRQEDGRLSLELDRPKLPAPPSLCAVPRYIGSHEFVGRASELQMLNAWANDESDPILLFEAIGGSGKSMLTWEWVSNHAVTARKDWAGRFWYSFYEAGARMICDPWRNIS